MRTHSRSAVGLALVLALALAAPGFAGAGVVAAEVGGLSLTTYAADAYEASGGDDIKASARDVTSLIADIGENPYEEGHSLDTASGTSGDQDWFKFTVTADDIIDKRGFLIEAFANHNSTDPVIEVYGPGLSFTPSTTPVWGDDDAAIQYKDDGPWMYRGTSLSFLPYEVTTTAGTYHFRVRPFSVGGSFSECAGPYVLRIKRGLLERTYGTDRVDTAVEISKEYMRSYNIASVHKAVVIANKDNFPDALAGAVTCGVGNGPLLLNPGTYLDSRVRNEVIRTGAQHVYVLGGEGVMAPAVVTSLQSLSPTITVIRLEGDTRYQTAMEIALASRTDASHFAGESTPTVAIVVNGTAWPDALAAAPLSTARNVPILLTGLNTLHPDTAEALYHLGTTDVIVVGGTGVVAESVVTSLAAQLGGADHVLRIYGDTRYETAKNFAKWACDLTTPGTIGDGSIGTTSSPTKLGQLTEFNVGIASGENFPDALAGAPMCGRNGFPLLLTQRLTVSDYIFEEYETKLPPGDTDWFSDTGGGPLLSSRLFGGSGAVSDGVFLEMDQFFGFSSP